MNRGQFQFDEFHAALGLRRAVFEPCLDGAVSGSRVAIALVGLAFILERHREC